MSDWWYIVAIVIVLAVAAFLYARSRNTGVSGGEASDPSRDYRDERETDRLAGMSDEDREWETASLDRNRRAQERDHTPPSAS